MPKIKRIQIKNFRSIVALDTELSDLSILVGDNDCGKSNILRALNLFFNGETNPQTTFRFRNDWNRYAITGAKQARQIEIILDIELPDSYKANNGDFVRWKKVWREAGFQDNKSEYSGKRIVSNKRGGGIMRVTF